MQVELAAHSAAAQRGFNVNNDYRVRYCAIARNGRKWVTRGSAAWKAHLAAGNLTGEAALFVRSSPGSRYFRKLCTLV